MNKQILAFACSVLLTLNISCDFKSEAAIEHQFSHLPEKYQKLAEKCLAKIPSATKDTPVRAPFIEDSNFEQFIFYIDNQRSVTCELSKSKGAITLIKEENSSGSNISFEDIAFKKFPYIQVKRDVPSDPHGTYIYLDLSGSPSEPILVSRRDGKSGSNYAKRIFNCKNKTTKYLGDGETLKAMERSKPSKSMGPIVDESIAFHQYLFACGKSK